MTFAEQLNVFLTSPASRMQLVTLRAIWRDRYVRGRLTCKGEQGVIYERLCEHLKATNPALVSFIDSIATTTNMHLDAVLMVPMQIPLTRQPITLPL
ncbi:hypothetical protein HX798_22305 [Pseudomonas putida]|jgi:hypothetical protein|uniref:Uncharacterized protein n=1 Tax=Pseudomonas putida TaxID=303 RepID=A0A7Y8D372_PSEPU|nr:hypothetical protein [Pseudomonas putida]NWC83000.1 hypothetical protein [Pseudomonas putida]